MKFVTTRRKRESDSLNRSPNYLPSEQNTSTLEMTNER